MLNGKLPDQINVIWLKLNNVHWFLVKKSNNLKILKVIYALKKFDLKFEFELKYFYHF